MMHQAPISPPPRLDEVTLLFIAKKKRQNAETISIFGQNTLFPIRILREARFGINLAYIASNACAEIGLIFVSKGDRW